ncbi:MAG: PEP-CTERM sorting domain-containing protein [Akkermansiaceae bacterium]
MMKKTIWSKVINTLSVLMVLVSEGWGAQTIVDNVFTNDDGGIESVSAVVPLGDTTATSSGTLGDGWETTVDVEGAQFEVAASIDGSGTLSVSGDGVLGTSGVVTLRREFSGIQLLDNQEYTISMGVSNSSIVGLLGDLDIVVGRTNGAIDTELGNTASVSGLLGIVDILGLFGTTSTATFNFLGSDFGSESLYVELRSQTGPDILSSAVVFDEFSITAIPEPSASILLGLGGLGLMLRRRN